MPRSVIFETPGHIDIRSFTVMGMNSKPNSVSPFGYFGTGLKYAIAVLVRERQQVTLWIGNKKYSFYARDIDFRGKSFSQIRMKREHWYTNTLGSRLLTKYEDLPFTTELGKNWKLWQAFRELESNTRDEGGITRSQHSEFTHIPNNVPSQPITQIVVTGDEFAKEWDERYKNFLDKDNLVLRDETDKIQIYNKPSHHVYYRGIRIHDWPENQESLLTYNIIDHLELSEDRMVKYEYQIHQRMGTYTAQATDVDIIRQIVSAKNPLQEAKIEWDYVYSSPSDEFKKVLQDSGKKRVSSGAWGYYSGYAPKEPPKVDPWVKWPRPWSLNEEAHDTYFMDANDCIVPEEGLKYAITRINKLPTQEED
jgi:hypothetical protein